MEEEKEQLGELVDFRNYHNGNLEKHNDEEKNKADLTSSSAAATADDSNVTSELGNT